MDDRGFDRIAQTVGQGTRRTAVLSALAGALGLAAVGPDEAEALTISKCVKRSTPSARKKCCKKLDGKKAKQKCQHKINMIHDNPPAPQCTTDGDCPEGEACAGGMCGRCPSGKTACNGACMDLSVCPGTPHVQCNNSPNCMCSRIADNNNTPICALIETETCLRTCGANNSCPDGMSCVMTCCEGKGNAGLRCMRSCG